MILVFGVSDWFGCDWQVLCVLGEFWVFMAGYWCSWLFSGASHSRFMPVFPSLPPYVTPVSILSYTWLTSVQFGLFGLFGLVWLVWFGRFGLVWIGLFGLLGFVW